MSFIRLHVTAEGHSEEQFVKKTLTPYLGQFDVFADVRRVLTSRNKKLSLEYRGGFIGSEPYATARKDITTWIKQDNHPECRFTTMFDLYALPVGFPGYDAAMQINDKYLRVKALEDALEADINDSRFIPYIQLHEFEALILADPNELNKQYLEHDRAIQRLVSMVANEGGNPELINDNYQTCPSRRIIAEIPEYEDDKATSGPLVAEDIGLPVIRSKCSHFNEWLTKLEELSQ